MTVLFQSPEYFFHYFRFFKLPLLKFLDYTIRFRVFTLFDWFRGSFLWSSFWSFLDPDSFWIWFLFVSWFYDLDSFWNLVLFRTLILFRFLSFLDSYLFSDPYSFESRFFEFWSFLNHYSFLNPDPFRIFLLFRNFLCSFIFVLFS